MRALRKSQQGLSIVEMMVALTIGLILIVGLTQIFVSNRKTFDITQANSRVQETGRIATQILSKAVRNADYWGCSSTDPINNLDSDGDGYDSVTLGFGEGLEGSNDNADASDDILDGTDTFTIRGARTNNEVELTTAMTQASAVLRVDEAGGLEAGDVIVISDCNGGDIFQATGVTGTTGNTNIGHNTGNTVQPGNDNPSNPGCPGSNAHCLSQVYDTGAEIAQPYYKQYFIGEGASDEPALFVRRGQMGGGDVGDAQEIELIEGVENMQILYGEDTDNTGTADEWLEADDVNNMDDVLSLRISLLVRSPEKDVVDNPQTYTFNGSSETESDKRLRRVYTVTSTIRNRM